MECAKLLLANKSLKKKKKKSSHYRRFSLKVLKRDIFAKLKQNVFVCEKNEFDIGGMTTAIPTAVGKDYGLCDLNCEEGIARAGIFE